MFLSPLFNSVPVSLSLSKLYSSIIFYVWDSIVRFKEKVVNYFGTYMKKKGGGRGKAWKYIMILRRMIVYYDESYPQFPSLPFPVRSLSLWGCGVEWSLVSVPPFLTFSLPLHLSFFPHPPKLFIALLPFLFIIKFGTSLINYL